MRSPEEKKRLVKQAHYWHEKYVEALSPIVSIAINVRAPEYKAKLIQSLKWARLPADYFGKL